LPLPIEIQKILSARLEDPR